METSLKHAQDRSVSNLLQASDDELMGLARDGHEGAFTQLVRRHERRVRSFCATLLGESGAARDAAQETFLRLFGARNRYRPRGRFKELLFTIARNECRSLRRRRWIRSMLGERLASEPEVFPPPDLELVDRERQIRLREALQRLPEKFRLPLTLRFVEQLDYDAIARIIGRTPSASRSRVHYGLRALSTLLPAEDWP